MKIYLSFLFEHAVLAAVVHVCFQVWLAFLPRPACEFLLAAVTAAGLLNMSTSDRQTRYLTETVEPIADKCEAALLAVQQLTLRFDTVARQSHAITLDNLKMHRAALNEMHWLSFYRRTLQTQILRVLGKRNAILRVLGKRKARLTSYRLKSGHFSSSCDDMNPRICESRVHSLT